MFRESHTRSIAKALTWRVLGTVATSLLVFIFTRKMALSLAVGAMEFLSKIGLFWLHERAWDKVRVGRRTAEPAVLWFTGLSGSGKSTIARRVHDLLQAQGQAVEQLDGDAIRDVFPQTGFTRDERNAHVRRVGYLASRLEKHGVVVIASLISPYSESRRFVRDLCQNFIEIHVATPLDECERRDPKGLYARARSGEISNFTGIDDPYEAPENPELVIATSGVTIDEAAAMVLKLLQQKRKEQHGSPARHRSPKHLHTPGGLRELPAVGNALVDRKG